MILLQCMCGAIVVAQEEDSSVDCPRCDEVLVIEQAMPMMA